MHRPEEQALLRNGDEASARGTDVAAALAGLREGERLLRADGGEVPKKAACEPLAPLAPLAPLTRAW